MTATMEAERTDDLTARMRRRRDRRFMSSTLCKQEKCLV